MTAHGGRRPEGSLEASLNTGMERGATVDASTFTAVEEWAKGWFRDSNGLDALSFQDLPVGWALHIDVFHAVYRVVLRALGRPEQVVGSPLLRGFKNRAIDRALRAWSLRLAGPRKAQEPAPIAFVSEMATPSALLASIAIASKLPRNSARILSADYRASRQWMARGHAATPLVVGLRDEWHTLRNAGRTSEQRWKLLRKALPPLLIEGKDMRSLALAAVDPIMRRSVPWLAVESRAIHRAFDEIQPHTVVLASDQHRIGRLVTHAAGLRGIRSIVLQHGLPQSTLGYLPLVADRMVTWSEGSAEWFVARGTAPERLVVAGNPRLDELTRRDADADRRFVAHRTGLAGSPRILVVLSVASEEVNLRVIDVALGALREFPNGTLLVKLHPGGSDWRAIESRLRHANLPSSRLHTTASADLYPILNWSDVVVVHRSTVAAEALAAGRPVVAVAATEPSIAALELRSVDLPEVASAQELAAYVRAGRAADGTRTGQVGQSDSLRRIIGPVDGRSVERTISMLLARPEP